MAGSSARRARRLNADNEKAADDEPAGDGEPAVRRPLNRTAATRPTAARPAAARPSAKRPTEAPAADRPGPAPTAPAAPAAAPPSTGRAPLAARIVGAIDKRGDAADQLASSVRMQGKETTYGSVAAVVLAVIPVVFLTVTTGKGAPPHPSSLAPAIGLVLALAMAASVRLSNRIVTALLAVTSTLATTVTQTPTSVRFLSTVDLLVALGFAMWVTLRQSKSRNAAMAERRKANQAARGTGGGAGSRPARGRRGRRAAEAAEPAGPPPSARYTPPKKRT
jgi:hypothetical protein